MALPYGQLDFSKLLRGDQILHAANTNYDAQAANLGVNANEAYARAVGAFGSTEGLPSWLPVSDQMRDLSARATQAGVSQLAQLAQNYMQARRSAAGGLAGHGLLHSGALGQANRELLQQRDVGHFDLSQKLMNTIYQARLSQQQGLDTLAEKRATAYQEALTRISNQIKSGEIGIPPTPGERAAAAFTPTTTVPRNQVATAVRTGPTTSYEPKALPGNIIRGYTPPHPGVHPAYQPPTPPLRMPSTVVRRNPVL
jgi:hypothetical protein